MSETHPENAKADELRAIYFDGEHLLHLAGVKVTEVERQQLTTAGPASAEAAE